MQCANSCNPASPTVVPMAFAGLCSPLADLIPYERLPTRSRSAVQVNRKGFAAPMPEIKLGDALGIAVVRASHTPLLLLDEKMLVVAASDSFFAAFGIDPAAARGLRIYALDRCHWDMPRLRSLLNDTLQTRSEPAALEMEISTSQGDLRHVVIKAQMLDYGDAAKCARMLVAITDVTNALRAESQRQNLCNSNAERLLEVQRQIDISFQILADSMMEGPNEMQIDRCFEHLASSLLLR